MPARSQAETERQLQQRRALVQNGQMDSAEAFGRVDEWTVQLGRRKALLHPGTGAWLWYDRMHDTWVPASCGVGEGILLTLGNTAGVKKLPQPGLVADWCIYRQDSAWQGPLPFDQLRQWLQTGQTPLTVQVWTPRATNWLSAAQFMALTECWGLAGSALASPLPFSAAITIGRDIDCDLKLADKQVSRKHARIEQREDGYWITDLGSSNGVFVNEKRISGAIRLTPGNQIRIGDTRLEVVAQAPSFEGVLPAKEGTPVRQSPAPSPTDQPAVGQVLSTNICPQCKQPIHAGARFCRYCGARLAA